MKISINIPQTWNDLTQRQLENISLVLHQNFLETKDMANPELAVAENKRAYHSVVRELLRENGLFKIFIALWNIPVKEYLSYSEFIFHKRDRTKFIPTVRIAGIIYYAPHFRLKNSTIGEFAFADSVYYAWTQTNNEVYLSLLCASLYRPRSNTPTEVDIRQPFSKLLAENHADNWQKVPLKRRLAIAFTFEGSRHHVVSIYPNIFPKSPAGKNKKNRPRYVPFGELISAKIDYDPSKLHQVQNLLMNEFFSIYERELIEQAKKPKNTKR